jgi:HEAT repeat protein
VTASDSAPTALDSAALAHFVRYGYVTVQTTLPADFHADIYRRAAGVLDREGNWGNNILPRIPELRYVLEDAAVKGALTSLLGATYALHPHRYCHRNEPGSTAQRLHKDTREFSGDRHLRHLRPRWLIAFYYPEDVADDMGPTAIVPGSQYYLEQPDASVWPEMLMKAPGGSVAIVHFGIWHGATANRSTRQRYMFKFQFARMDEPGVSGITVPAAWESDLRGAPHAALWSRMLGWLQGDGHATADAVGAASVSALRSDDVNERRVAADRLACAPEAAAVPNLAVALSDADEAVRLNASMALAGVGEAALPALDDTLRSPDRTGTRYAAFALSEMGAPAVELLVERMRDADEQVAINASDALGNMGPEAAAAEPALRAALKADDPWRRRHAAEALGILGPAARPAVPDLAEALHDEHPYVRFNAATALARIGPGAAEATRPLVGALDDEDRYTRAWAAQALQRIGTPEATDALLDRLMVSRWCATTRTDDRY